MTGNALRQAFQGELVAVGDGLVEMTRLVGSAMARATTSLLEADAELAGDVIASDRVIDKRRDEIDEKIIDLLTRQQPVVATDLRVLVAGLRITADLERMGDLAQHVAKVTRLRHPHRAVPIELVSTILEMGYLAQFIVTGVGEVIASRSVAEGLQLELRDDEMDHLHSKMFQILLDPSWPHGVAAAVDATLLSRYYERFADHAVSVARRVTSLVTAGWPQNATQRPGPIP